jgi:hypothetical protein
MSASERPMSGSDGVRGFVKFVLLALLVTGAVLLAGYLPTRRLGGPEAVPAMIAGAGVSLLAAAAGAVPLMARRSGHAGKGRVVAATALRFAVALAGALVGTLAGGWERLPFLLWVVVSYGILLVAETAWLLRAA